MITLGIDASNIISGGGVTHLIEILGALDLNQHCIDKVEVWAPEKTGNKIESQERLVIKKHADLEKNVLKRQIWQHTFLTSYAKENYDILYIPGGSYTGSYRPFVTMNRNLLPFDRKERNRYGFGYQKFRMWFLEKVQAYTYRNARGVIFLSEEAKRQTEQTIGQRLPNAPIIPHGIAQTFFKKPRKQKDIEQYNFNNPFRFLYVSTVTVYKHQWNVVKAVNALRDEGYPVELDLVGGITTKKGGRLLNKARNKYDPGNNFVIHHGYKNHLDLQEIYWETDGFVFASSCETFGQTLLEAMASGLPIACSDASAMTEVLFNNGCYFDPENPKSIEEALKKMLDSADLRQKLAEGAFQRAKTYSWKKCARETFNFICSANENGGKG